MGAVHWEVHSMVLPVTHVCLTEYTVGIVLGTTTPVGMQAIGLGVPQALCSESH